MTVKVPLTDGTFALVDDEDAWVLRYRWSIRSDSEMVFALKPHPPKGTVLRRLIAGVDKGGYVSHLNGDQRDCRRANLTTVHPNAAQRPPEFNADILVIPNEEGGYVAMARDAYVGSFGDRDEAFKEAQQALALQDTKR